jgi:GPH family glycoside/pentoside/hexuronide:cation symporter
MARGYASVFKLKPIRYLLSAGIFYLIANTICGADRLYFYTYNLGFDAASVTAVLLFTSVIGLLLTPAIVALTRWLDKRSLLIVMMLVSAVSVSVAKFTGISTVAGMMLFTFVFCIGSSAYWQLMPAMIYDICEYDELETGNRREGSIVSLLSVAEALSQAIAIQLLGIILQLAGFNGETAAQPPTALEWVENSLMIIPAVFMILTVVMVYLYPITKKKFEEIQAELRKK